MEKIRPVCPRCKKQGLKYSFTTGEWYCIRKKCDFSDKNESQKEMEVRLFNIDLTLAHVSNIYTDYVWEENPFSSDH